MLTKELIKRASQLFVLLLFLAAFIGCKNEDSDLQKVFQMTLDLPELQEYYHVDSLPERKPLIVLKNEYLNNTPHLVKFNEPVTFLTQEEIYEKGIDSFVPGHPSHGLPNPRKHLYE